MLQRAQVKVDVFLWGLNNRNLLPPIWSVETQGQMSAQLVVSEGCEGEGTPREPLPSQLLMIGRQSLILGYTTVMYPHIFVLSFLYACIHIFPSYEDATYKIEWIKDSLHISHTFGTDGSVGMTV